MKVGDKVYCINTRLNPDKGNSILTKGKYYIITEIEDNTIRVTSDIGLFFNYRKKHSDMFFSFDDFFMNEKEVRKLKLKTIYESS